MAASLGRLVIYTSKIDKMADFYARYFGFSVLRAGGDRIVELIAQTPSISLLLHPAAAKQKEGQVLVKLVFDVEDVSAFCEAAMADGLDFGKIHKADGYEFANAKDPSKNSIQVSSRAFRE
ncbi:VOC family protein [Thioclava atlantica]|uniref:Glyoxalase/bleomycin resistance protein/dioxygenase n=1 Tax=Thioclava atlantica TaxID=1317124 RepID=A0A085TTP9_9RHOB|nr:VOC family protein [Thioclava atlantica]KFE34096.1 glyoxalase/bleomycin resistance protein/dioxygenase [Thioclava atlantica]